MLRSFQPMYFEHYSMERRHAIFFPDIVYCNSWASVPDRLGCITLALLTLMFYFVRRLERRTCFAGFAKAPCGTIPGLITSGPGSSGSGIEG